MILILSRRKSHFWKANDWMFHFANKVFGLLEKLENVEELSSSSFPFFGEVL